MLASTFKTRPPLQPISIRMGRADRFAEGLSNGADGSSSSLASVAINATGKNETTGSACFAANLRRQV